MLHRSEVGRTSPTPTLHSHRQCQQPSHRQNEWDSPYHRCRHQNTHREEQTRVGPTHPTHDSGWPRSHQMGMDTHSLGRWSRHQQFYPTIWDPDQETQRPPPTNQSSLEHIFLADRHADARRSHLQTSQPRRDPGHRPTDRHPHTTIPQEATQRVQSIQRWKRQRKGETVLASEPLQSAIPEPAISQCPTISVPTTTEQPSDTTGTAVATTATMEPTTTTSPMAPTSPTIQPTVDITAQRTRPPEPEQETERQRRQEREVQTTVAIGTARSGDRSDPATRDATHPTAAQEPYLPETYPSPQLLRWYWSRISRTTILRSQHCFHPQLGDKPTVSGTFTTPLPVHTTRRCLHPDQTPAQRDYPARCPGHRGSDHPDHSRATMCRLLQA